MERLYQLMSWKVKTLLKNSIDMENLFTDYSDLTSQVARCVEELIEKTKSIRSINKEEDSRNRSKAGSFTERC